MAASLRPFDPNLPDPGEPDLQRPAPHVEDNMQSRASGSEEASRIRYASPDTARKAAMTIAYACVLIAALLPYAWTVIAKTAAPQFDNRDPRGWLARQDNPRVKRANAAQLNAFEAFPAFAAGVLMAQLAGVDPQRIATLSVAFVALRALHGVCYLTGLHVARTLVWFAGLGCVAALMAQAAIHVG